MRNIKSYCAVCLLSAAVTFGIITAIALYQTRDMVNVAHAPGYDLEMTLHHMKWKDAADGEFKRLRVYPPVELKYGDMIRVYNGGLLHLNGKPVAILSEEAVSGGISHSAPPPRPTPSGQAAS